MATTTYVALLRGVNVGGAKRVPMPELRVLLEELGHGAVSTYLNSGNAVLAASGTASAVEAGLVAALERRFGFAVPCLVRDLPCLRAVVEGNPFVSLAEESGGTVDGSRLHVTFLSGRAEAAWFEGIDAEAYLPDEFRLGGREMYLSTPNGLGRSKLAEILGRSIVRNTDVIATTRNWNTVLALLRKAEDCA
jgi:uncharacterized protein (DUF1697 family)